MTINSSIFNHDNRLSRILHEDSDASYKISKELLNLLPKEKLQPIVFVCIGTDRSTGDSLGPLVGTLLKEKKTSTSSFYVYGTLAEPIHAMNLEEKLAEIEKLHTNPFIIGIDACLGKVRSVGIVQIGEGPVKPGAGVNKELPSVGHAHITGIVNVSGFMEFMVLQNTRLNLVLNMAKTIADGIHSTHLQFNLKHNFQPLPWSINQEKTL
ncbi:MULTISPECIES: spore protease YyaC [Peribacillus]|uniref:Sporulation protein n=1 Tax=Peribacillus asahii TaxID=228899 RepID=A0A3T0KZ76_9BACI|nr:spore protease YyaC [Peribacillus asahii]AZV45640.1 sporulation protein [Peribacillus asahii]USK59875.1 spore protease YyaC [Peribacillus asahii]USK85189.1 spore protease YyaC [Peribacillus asahii]